MMIYIYALHCPMSGDIRYIGKTSNCEKRLKSHIRDSRNLEKNHQCVKWIRTLTAQGHKPILTELHSIDDGGDWQTVEKEYIAKYLASGHQLTNTTIGGNGFKDISKTTAEARMANISAGLFKAWKKPEYRESHRVGRVAFLSSPEVRAEMSKRTKKTSNLPEVKLKNSNAQKLVWAQKKEGMSAEEYEKYCSAYKSKLWNDPEFKARRTAELQSPDVKARRYATRDTPEGISRRSAKLKAAWADPERRARRLAVMQSAEYKAKISVAGKAANARKLEQRNINESRNDLHATI